MQDHLNFSGRARPDNGINTISFVDETIAWERIKHLINHFPDENQELMPGIKWGSYTQVYTPAFWKFQYLLSYFFDGVSSHRLSTSILDEIVMCILGGYGIPSLQIT